MVCHITKDFSKPFTVWTSEHLTRYRKYNMVHIHKFETGPTQYYQNVMSHMML